MIKLANFLLVLASVSCSKLSTNPALERPYEEDPLLKSQAIVENMEYPQSFQLSFKGQVIADLSSNEPLLSAYGQVARGTTLNLLTIEGIEFLVYGEDGVFATECECHADYPNHGPTHPLCEVAGAESFDKIILCTATNQKTSLMQAQNWPGVPSAMLDKSSGMNCWVNGVKMKSSKIFTY